MFYRAIARIAAFCIGFAITFWFVDRQHVPTIFGAFKSPAGAQHLMAPVITAAYGFLMTLLGVLLGTTYRHLIELKACKRKVLFWRLIKDVSTSVDFYIGIVGAPIVFGLLWSSLPAVSVSGITCIALQNGFAAQAILAQFTAAHDPAPPVN